MENPSKFIVDPRIDKPWGEYSKGKATTNRALAVYKSGALVNVNS